MTPITDEEEQKQKDEYENIREVGWPPLWIDLDFARRFELALRKIEDHHGEDEGWRRIASEALERINK